MVTEFSRRYETREDAAKGHLEVCYMVRTKEEG